MKSCHDAIYVVGMVRAQEETFKFFQTLNGCVICFDTMPVIFLVRGVVMPGPCAPGVPLAVSCAF